MSLLREIQADLADTQTSLESVLLKSKILASRLGSDDLRQWLDFELSGYPDLDDLPDYRILPTESFGQLASPFGGGANNVPIPKEGLPEEIHGFMSAVNCAQSVAEIENLIKKSGSVISLPWPADLIGIISGLVRTEGNAVLVSAQRIVAAPAFRGILGAVRSKLLGFVLDIEQANPEAGESSPGEIPVAPERVSQIYNINISGGGQVIAGSRNSTQTNYSGIQPGDLESLRQFFTGEGLREEDLDDLDTALKADKGKPTKDKFGKNVAGWIAKMVGKAASGVWNVSLDAAGQLLGTALKRYYELT